MDLKLNSKKIKKLLKKRGLTYDDVARINNIKHRESISSYLKNESLKSTVIFAKALKCKPKDLLI